MMLPSSAPERYSVLFVRPASSPSRTLAPRNVISRLPDKTPFREAGERTGESGLSFVARDSAEILIAELIPREIDATV